MIEYSRDEFYDLTGPVLVVFDEHPEKCFWRSEKGIIAATSEAQRQAKMLAENGGAKRRVVYGSETFSDYDEAARRSFLKAKLVGLKEKENSKA